MFNSNTATGLATATATAPNLITGLQPFFLTKQMFVKKSQKIKPIEKDSLFWCYYILKNGQSKYEQLQHGSHGISYVKERQLKIQLVEELRGEILRNKLKLCKLGSIDHIEDQLGNEQTIDLITFFSLCFIDNIEVFYFKNKCYYKTLKEDPDWMSPKEKEKEPAADLFETIYDRNGTGYDDDYDFSVINLLKQTQGKYWIEETNVLDIDWSSCYHINNINKPLKAASAYTATQIKELAQKFGIDSKGKKKQEIYDLVKSFVKIDLI
jgi:hypothetical protein